MSEATERWREQNRLRQQRHRERARALRHGVTQADEADVSADDNASQDAQPPAYTGDSSPINPLPDSQPTCLKCDAQFGADEWLCASGMRHVVAPKQYLLADAPAQAARDDRGNLMGKTGRTIITNIPPGRPASEVPPGSDDVVYGGGCVTFVDGRYVTSDPVEQYWLDKRGGYCTEAEWDAVWLSPAELERKRLDQQEQELREGQQRLRELAREVSKLKEAR